MPLGFRRCVPLALAAAVLALAACAIRKSPDRAAATGTAPTRAPFPTAAPARPKALSGATALVYPPAERHDTADTYHGVPVPDPYRWLEDAESPATRAWIDAQVALTESYLAAIPAREPVRQRLTRLWNYERFGTPEHEGGRYVFTRNTGLQKQSVYYVTESLDAEPRVLIDPNTLSPDGTVSLAGSALSRDGRYFAYGLSDGGSDWRVWKVRDVATGADLPDEVRWVKWSSEDWAADSSGFFYSRYPQPPAGQELQVAASNQKLYFHRVGTPQEQDELVYERPDQPDWGFGAQVSDDGRWLVIHVWSTKRENAVFYKDLSSPGSPVVELLSAWDATYSFVGNEGGTFWFQTDRDAPRGRVVAVDTARPDPEHWRDVIPQAREALQSVSVVGDRFFASYLKDARSEVRLFDLRGRRVGAVALPGLGDTGGFAGRRGDAETFYYFTGFTTPTTIYRYDIARGVSEVFRRPAVDFDPSAFQTEQVFYRSRDGTRVPMFIVSKKGLKRDGSHPTLLYGYGGFNIPITPSFSIPTIVWLEMGGVYASANLRGGSEYGEEWHQAGTKLDKQNVFDDFIAAAEHLIEKGYTSTPKLAIMGGSNGGLLVGACMNQRPDLFGACIPQVGVMDMIRFVRFTGGRFWTSDYGSPDDPAQFRALLAYSPYHNLRPGACYPPTLVMTADRDDRVVPAHSFKYAAALQAAQACAHPTLIRIETRAGHGAGTPVTKAIDAAADRTAFLVRALDMTPPPAP